MERLATSLREAPIVRKGEYHYFVHPITDGVPPLEPALLREVAVGIIKRADLTDIDVIVAPEAMGIHLSTAVSLMTDLPLVVARKRSYGLDGEVSVAQITGYSEATLYLNEIDAGDRVLILDDVYSTGGTLAALTDALDQIGAEIADVIVAIRKVGGEKALDGSPYEPTSLIDVDVVDGDVVIVDEDGRD
ncbi:MAG: hypoxanthine/guanine phosphoribosyltransferase [Salinirussus sp.]